MSNKPFPSREEVLALRKQYDVGTIIELIACRMNGAIFGQGISGQSSM